MHDAVHLAMHRVRRNAPPVQAGYSEAKTESIDAQRAQLSRSLAASMKANLLGAGDVEEQLFADKERKADLEATKAALRHQVAAERSRGF